MNFIRGTTTYRNSDLMLLNNGKGSFETTTMHGANDSGGPGNGDMGQAFDFDLDGDLDLLNGSEDGQWYLYSNQQPGKSNHALVRVCYAPESGIDAITAEVIKLSIKLTTDKDAVENKTHLFMPSLVERDTVCEVAKNN